MKLCTLSRCLLALLAVATLLGGTVLASAPASSPATITNPEAKPAGIYVFWDWSNLSPKQYPIVGGHMAFVWNNIETAPGVYDWTSVDKWLSGEVKLGKRAGIQIDAYEGQARGGVYIPVHHRTSTPQILVTCPDGSVMPRYWDASYKLAFGNLVRAFGARYANDPRIAWVEISGRDQSSGSASSGA